MDRLRGHYAKWNKSDKEKKVIWYHLYMEPKKYNRLVNVTEKKKTHRSRSPLYPDVGKDWGWKESGATDDEMGWMESPAQWTWVWSNSRRQWRTRKPDVLQFMGSQRVGCDFSAEQQQTEQMMAYQWYWVGQDTWAQKWEIETTEYNTGCCCCC